MMLSELNRWRKCRDNWSKTLVYAKRHKDKIYDFTFEPRSATNIEKTVPILPIVSDRFLENGPEWNVRCSRNLKTKFGTQREERFKCLGGTYFPSINIGTLLAAPS